jgi:hypothetical protein
LLPYYYGLLRAIVAAVSARYSKLRPQSSKIQSSERYLIAVAAATALAGAIAAATAAILPTKATTVSAANHSVTRPGAITVGHER